MAGLAGVLIALLTLAATVPGGSTPNPVPANSWASTYTPPQEYRNPPATAPAQPRGGPSAACQQGKAAVTTYEEADNPDPYSKANAAQRAVSGIQGAMGSSAGGIVLTDLEILYKDFGTLLGSADNPDYNLADAAIRTDGQQLWKDCGTS